MPDTSSNPSPGRSMHDVKMMRQARRLVGMERSYSCSNCGHTHVTWQRTPECPRCGEQLLAARIGRIKLGRTV